MNERCSQCGAELFAGQQFCRQCGTPTRKLSSGEMPTQIFPAGQSGAQEQQQQQQQAAQQPFPATHPLASRDTDPVYHSSFAAQYQTPAGAPAALPTETARLQRKRRRWRGWVVAFLCLVVFFGAGSFFVAQIISDRLARRVVVRRETPRGVTVVPPVPPVPGMGDADANAEGLSPLDEEGAQVSGDKTVITKTFPLKPDAAFSLSQVTGDVTIEGWDEPEAQVKITKRGGDADDRAGVEIMHAATEKGLTLRTPQEMDEVREVRYEIKLPRTLRQVQISGLDSDVSLANVAGAVAVNLMRGNVAAQGVTGGLSVNTKTGNVSVDLHGASPQQPQAFNTLSGNVSLKVGGADCVVKAETMSGELSADDSLDVNVEKQMVVTRASGTLGHGGQPVTAKTLSGNIKIKK